MSAMTPAIEVEHPAWCDTAHCEALAGGLTHHLSTPVNWLADGGHAEIVMARSQYDSHEPHMRSYYLEIRRHDVEDEVVTITWTQGDTEQLLRVQDYLDGLD
jgi:hypothetical protein